jgi:hypothetical protein
MESNIKINYSKYKLETGKEGIIMILMYSGLGDPKIALGEAINKITEDIGHFEFIDSHLDYPWVKVIMTNVNDMKQEDFDHTKHNLKTLLQ